MSDIEKVFILAATLWVTAVGFIIFSWLLEVRRQQALVFIARRLESIDKRLRRLTGEVRPERKASVEQSADSAEAQTAIPVVDIPKNMPLSAYESVTLPDNAAVHFVDEHAS